MDHQDSFWVERACRGDNHAFGLLIDKYRPQLEGLIANSLGPDEVPDLLQETFLQAYLSLDRLRDPERFDAWLYGIALNLIRMHHRRGRRADVTSWEALQGGTTRPLDGALRTDSAEDLALTRAVHAALRSAIENLSEVNREAVVLYYIDGLSYREIADLLTVPLSTVKSRLHKARQQLRIDLAPVVVPPMQKEKPLMTEATVYEVYTVERPEKGPHTVVVLKARDRDRYLPMWIGDFEGTAIKLQLSGVETPRPLTYNLMANLLTAAGGQVEAVHINELREDTFIGSVQLRTNGQIQHVDARPSDGLALALRVNAPISVDDSVWERAGTDSPTDAVNRNREDIAVTSMEPVELPDPFLTRTCEETVDD
jgi:RNA polymerase sigma factor (sigma-70 family)